MRVIGIDPGKNGGVALVGSDGTAEAWAMPQTVSDMVELFRSFKDIDGCWLEKVHSMPGQGVASSFSFGQNYGQIQSAVIAAGIPLHDVAPGIWMKTLGLGVSMKEIGKQAWKVHLKGLAQQHFPSIKVTLKNADALLLAEYGLRECLNGK